MKFIGNLLNALASQTSIALCEWPGAHQKPVMFLATFRAAAAGALDATDAAASRGLFTWAGQHVARGDRRRQSVKRGAVVVAEDGRVNLCARQSGSRTSRPDQYREPLLGEHTEEVLPSREVVKAQPAADTICVGASSFLPAQQHVEDRGQRLHDGWRRDRAADPDDETRQRAVAQQKTDHRAPPRRGVANSRKVSRMGIRR